MNTPIGKQGRALLAVLTLVSSTGIVACDEESAERRAREAAEKNLEAIPNRMAVAMAQQATPEEITQAQESLTSIKEYMGEINGKLDTVTINAIQTVQRAHGLDDDGILNAKTKAILAEVKK